MMKSVRLDADRVYLRLTENRDINAIIKYFKENEEHLKPWDPIRPKGFLTDLYWQKYVDRAKNEFLTDSAARFLVFNKKTDHLIGRVNFTNFERGPFQNCRLGYQLHKDFVGSGIMYESLVVGINYIFSKLNFHRIEANFMPKNERSKSLLNRLGFIENGLAQKYLNISGEWEDHILSSLISTDWNKTA